MDDTENLLKKLANKINFGHDLLKKLQIIQDVDGVSKLQRKIRQEIEFLNRLLVSKNVKKEQLCCSNLTHLGALVDCALRPNVTSVCKNFHLNDTSKLVVDVINNEGQIWTKVIARNPRSLSALSQGNSSYGARSILDQAKDYMQCAILHPSMYNPPQVIFEFVSGIEEALANKLGHIGIIVKGEVLPNSINLDSHGESSDSEAAENSENLPQANDKNMEIKCPKGGMEIDTLNLDVTAMMAYVSNMTNGHCRYIFKQEVLTQQAAWEAMRPVKPILNKLFEGKKLVCCNTAWEEFQKIVNILGGPMEKERTAQLKKEVTILPDDFGGDDDAMRKDLRVRGHVRTRSKIIFNFGHRIKALTVSANEGFVRAASQQGITYAAFVHESRALTEGKERTANCISAS